MTRRIEPEPRRKRRERPSSPPAPAGPVDPEADAALFAEAVHDLAEATAACVGREEARRAAALPNSPRVADAIRTARERGWVDLKYGKGGGFIAGRVPLPG